MNTDKDARFRELFQSGKDAIYRICCCYLRDPEDRNDAFQEVLLKLYRHLDSFRGKSSCNTWLYRIAVNTCLDFLRRRKRHEKHLDRSTETDTANLEDASRNVRRIDGAIDMEKMYACIARLPVLERSLVSLYLEEASTREMADVIGISEANIRVKLARIRDTLRQMLGGDHHGSR